MSKNLFDNEKQFQGLDIGDTIEISPLYGRKRLIALKTTVIDFKTNPFEEESLGVFIIASHLNTANHYRLILEKNTYKLTVIKGPPFLLNGVWANDAYVFSGDCVTMMDASFNFSKKKEKLENASIEIPENVIDSSLRIMITGETGTGKTSLARKIHEKSNRRGAFISINLSSLNPSLIESELFGHKKGSFTGAITTKLGAFKEADHGTLFLDEIDSLPLDLQTKLLGFLDDHKFRSVGDTKEEKVSTRLIFASGRELQSLVESGKMRKDFYFRLKSGYSIALRSLRDDTALIEKYINDFCISNNICLTHRLKEFYKTLTWPGNIRELFGHLDKKKIMGTSRKIDFDIWDEELIVASSNLEEISISFNSLEKTKKEYAAKVLVHFKGNYRQAAKTLLITEKTLKSIIREAS